VVPLVFWTLVLLPVLICMCWACFTLHGNAGVHSFWHLRLLPAAAAAADAAAAGHSLLAAAARDTHCLQVQPSQSFKACSTGDALVEIYLN
jgi:hypothetical protein